MLDQWKIGKGLGKGITVHRMAREQDWAKKHFGDLKVVNHVNDVILECCSE